MKKFILFCFFAVIFLIFTNCTLVQENAGNGDDEKEWAILLYQGADNNLDPVITSDFVEAFYSTYNKEKIHLLALLDRSEHYNISNINEYAGEWTDTKLFDLGQYIYDNRIEPSFRTPLEFEIASEELGLTKDKVEELDMGDPETLRKFVSFARNNYKSKNIALIFASHGDGWFIYDDSRFYSRHYNYGIQADKNLTKIRPSLNIDNTNSGGHLNLSEINQVLSNDPVTVIGFDVCLMGGVEVVYELKDSADYFVFSEDEESGNGWDYLDFLKRFTKTDLSAEDFVKCAVDSFDNWYKDRITSLPGYILAGGKTEDITYFLENSFNDFVNNYLKFQPASQIATARDNAKILAGFGHSYIDLKVFINEFNNYENQSALLNELNNIFSSIASSDSYSEFGGIHIYFPESASTYRSNYSQLSFANLGWYEFLTDYFNL